MRVSVHVRWWRVVGRHSMVDRRHRMTGVPRMDGMPRVSRVSGMTRTWKRVLHKRWIHVVMWRGARVTRRWKSRRRMSRVLMGSMRRS